MRRASGPPAAVPAPAAAAVLAALGCGVLLTGCGAPSGLGEGGPAPSATTEAQPKNLWPAWSPGSPAASDAAADPARQPAPDPLSGAPTVPPGGLAAMDQLDVLRADPRMARPAGRGAVDRPGTPGVRPAALHDLTGDRQPELISAVDLESGRMLLAVYTVREGQIVPVLHTSGLRPVVEAVGEDLVVRGPTADGGEQAVRYRWDGRRMVTASEVRSVRTTSPEPDAPTAPAPRTSSPGGTAPAPRTSSPEGPAPAPSTSPPRGPASAPSASTPGGPAPVRTTAPAAAPAAGPAGAP
ncbi:hypothetical protein ACIQM4_16420 [Streptomyces sp. NPDC091272]|uniref:hypothetical protein n=1 Tax=Streptomyces sp. NPDC091272 TaxID=3365981 RepID=UPI00381C4EDC